MAVLLWLRDGFILHYTVVCLELTEKNEQLFFVSEFSLMDDKSVYRYDSLFVALAEFRNVKRLKVFDFE
jgi:hypothetical protein